MDQIIPLLQTVPLLEASLASAYFSDLICLHPAPAPKPSDTLALSGFLNGSGILLPGLLRPTLEGPLLPSGFSSGAPSHSGRCSQAPYPGLLSSQHTALNCKHHLITHWTASSASVESKFHYSQEPCLSHSLQQPLAAHTGSRCSINICQLPNG